MKSITIADLHFKLEITLKCMYSANQFKTMWIDDDDTKRLLIICAGSRKGELTVYWVDDPDNDWSRTSKIKKTIIGRGMGLKLQ